jgi:GNAT superfamily N-acetyltransferase
MKVLRRGHVEVAARDGRLVRVRPLGWGEREPVEAVFAAMSAESRRMRFLAPMPRLPGAMLRRMTEVDHDRHGAWVALDAGRPVGEARYVRFAERPWAADVAVSVIDEWQGRGLGRVLLEVLGVAAADVGVTSFAWTMDPANARILRLVGRYGGARHVDGDVVEALTFLPAGRGVDAGAVRKVAARARAEAALARAA